MIAVTRDVSTGLDRDGRRLATDAVAVAGGPVHVETRIGGGQA